MTALVPDPSLATPVEAFVGCEWIVDASGCAGDLLKSLDVLHGVCERIIRELDLRVVGPPLWRQFPEPGGVTGLCLLSESHLACHTWPELGLATFNLFCCRRRREWPWDQRLREMLGAEFVSVRIVQRGVFLPETNSTCWTGGGA